MAEIERKIVEALVEGLEANAASAAHPGMSSMNAGPGTSPGTNYSKDATPGGGVVGQHESAGTRPFEGLVGQEHTAALAETIRATKLARIQADASFREFDRGHRGPPEGFVTGLHHIDERIKR